MPLPEDDPALARALEDQVARVIHSVQRTAQAVTSAPLSGVWRDAHATVLGGKLVRPMIVANAVQALTGRALIEEEVRVAAALEILHYAFLLHDDVIDGDVERRGQPNLIARQHHDALSQGASPEQAQQWGTTTAILVGDLMLAAVHQVFARLSLPEATRLALLDALEHTVIVTTMGELMDVGLTSATVPRDLPTVLAMSAAKTGVYTVEFPLRTAMILGGASTGTQQAVAEFATPLGMAYQLQDDLLCVFGNAATYGKDPLSDLREGKETALIAVARGRRDDIDALLEQSRTDPCARQALKEALAQCGARAEVEAMVDRSLRQSRQALSGADHIPAALATMLAGLLSRVEGRPL